MVDTYPSRIDQKGRLSLPKKIREKLNTKPGDIVYFKVESDGTVLLHVGINPFDALAEQAIREYRAGKTENLDDFDWEQEDDERDDAEE